jgi:hypothetical protein
MFGGFFLSGLSLLFAGNICHVAAAIKPLVMTAEARCLIDGRPHPSSAPLSLTGYEINTAAALW